MLHYDPERRACPGAWGRLGTGANARPFAQTAIRRGATGQAIQLTSASDRSGTLTGWHNASPDRSKLSAALDTSITNGRCVFTFWLWRKSAEAGVAAYLQGDGTQCDVGVRIAPGTGRLSYSTGTKAGAGIWVETPHTIPVGEWRKLTITVNLELRSYVAEVGDAEKIALCEPVPLVMPKERFVEQPGVNIPIAVPVFKEFQRVAFLPEGAPGHSTVLDDLAVHWQPALRFAKPGPDVVLSEDFEAQLPQASFPAEASDAAWKLEPPGTKSGFYITNGTSFGAGVNSLRATGEAALHRVLPATLDPAARATLDVDFFLRSGEGFPYLIPNPAARSPHATAIGLSGPDGKIIAGAAAKNGTWQIWDGRAWSDTGERVHHDVWNHLQLALDGKGSYTVVVQPTGQVAGQVASGRIGEANGSKPITVFLQPSKTGGHLSCYDNLVVTSGSK